MNKSSRFVSVTNDNKRSRMMVVKLVQGLVIQGTRRGTSQASLQDSGTFCLDFCSTSLIKTLLATQHIVSFVFLNLPCSFYTFLMLLYTHCQLCSFNLLICQCASGALLTNSTPLLWKAIKCSQTTPSSDSMPLCLFLNV